VLAGWIAAGCPPPRPDDRRIVALAAWPDAVRLEPGRTQQVLVQAIDSEGRVEDVTRWAKFASTDETVVRVDESGRSTVLGHGEAAITVWYASLVAKTTVTSPYETAPDPRVFAQAPRHNPIDARNLAKLEALKIPPSPDAGDAPFLRRAYLDATGTLAAGGRGRGLPGRPRPRETGPARRSPAGQRGVSRLLGVQVVRPLPGLVARSCRRRRCGRSTGSSGGAWPRTSAGTRSPGP